MVYALNIADGAIARQTKVAGGSDLLSGCQRRYGVGAYLQRAWLQALNEADGAVKWTVNLICLRCRCAVNCASRRLWRRHRRR